jgi:hypothetical protein
VWLCISGYCDLNWLSITYQSCSIWHFPSIFFYGEKRKGKSVQRCTVQFSTLQYSIVQYITEQYSTIFAIAYTLIVYGSFAVMFCLGYEECTIVSIPCHLHPSDIMIFEVGSHSPRPVISNLKYHNIRRMKMTRNTHYCTFLIAQAEHHSKRSINNQSIGYSKYCTVLFCNILYYAVL